MRRQSAPYALAFAVASMFGTAAQAQNGARLFQQRCAVCHSVQAGEKAFKAGPNLAGVVGRKAGSAGGARYSKAMIAAGFTWDRARLEAYLTNPRAVIPGTTMSIAVPEPTTGAAIIAYLASGK